FVWFQGWNDMVNGGTYPNRDKPRGYEQYSWLLEHFIRDVRKDLDSPDLPFVIGVLGVGGVEDPPTSNRGYFQQAMAAPADNPEFEGTITAIHTGRYWDHELDALATKSREVRNKKSDLQYKDGLKGEALEKAYAEYRAKNITPEEEEILKKGISNAGYHYLGSAKIMAGIGKGFAEAMVEM
ncbi:MAG: sialate O-acetylesterase, partial [Planctomycetota bacterium]